MKRKNRDIQVFNISALDLFASALGAFILISVVLFPFFPNTGQSEEIVEALKKQIRELTQEVGNLKSQLDRAADSLRQALKERDEARAVADQTQKRLDEARAVAEQTRKSLEEMKPKPLDLVIMLDITGSMGDEIKDLTTEIGALASLTRAISPDVAMRIVAYGDRGWAGRIPGYERTPSRGVTVESALAPIVRGRPGLQTLRQFLQGLTPEMGASGLNTDPPEAVLEGLTRSIQGTPWRAAPGNRRIIVITDAPPYSEEAEATLSLASQFAGSRQGNQISTIFVKRSDNDSNAEPFLRRLASSGQGIFRTHNRSQGSELLDYIVEAVLR